MEFKKGDSEKPITKWDEERYKELERNSIYYTQLRYVLGELLKSSDPNQVLASILHEISTLTGGKPTLAIEFQEGMWDLFSLSYYKEQGSWYPRHLVDSNLYYFVMSEGELYYNLSDISDTSIPDVIINYMERIDGKTAIFLPLEGTPSMVVEVNDVIIPDRIERYLEAVREFVIPLRLSIQHALLLEDSNRARRKSDLLLDLLFHDIRSSISSLTIALELMELKWADSSKAHSLLHDATIQSQEANELLNRVKKVLITQTNQKLIPYDPEKVIKSAISNIEAIYPGRPLQFRIESRIMKGVKVLANDLLHDVVLNLLTNAVKAMDDRNEEICIEIEEWNAVTDFIRISVIDKGKGMPENLKPRIAGRFLTESADGIGLGLSIVMRLVEDYGGYLWYENRVPDDWTKGTKANIALQRTEEEP